MYLRASGVFGAHPEVTALLDGPMFDDPNVIAYRYLDRAAGIDYPGRNRARGATLNVVPGRAPFWLENDGLDPEAIVAVQGPFTVIREGRADFPADRETVRVWRAGLGTLTDGRLLWAVGHGGVRQWADRVAAATYPDGARVARMVYTDGGHSTILWARDGSQRVGYPGDDPRIFGFLVERDGPASPMPAPRPFGSSGGAPLGAPAPRGVPLGPATARGSRWWYLAAALGAVATARGPELVRVAGRIRK